MNLSIAKSVTSLVLIATLISCNQNLNNKEVSKADSVSISKIHFDSIKAKKYGADAYGMKKYILAFLKRGPNQSVDSIKKQELQRAHMQNIDRLAEEGKLVLAGPFFGNEELRGIYIFNVDNLEEAERLTQTDPSILAGVLTMELKEWYGSAALMEVNDIHNSLNSQGISSP